MKCNHVIIVNAMIIKFNRVLLSKKAQAKAREAGVDVWADGSMDQDQYYRLFRSCCSIF